MVWRTFLNTSSSKVESRKVSIAPEVKWETTAPLGWIGENLHMGTRSTVSRKLGVMAKRLPKERRWNILSKKLITTAGAGT
jgi:hypothetical protein